MHDVRSCDAAARRWRHRLFALSVALLGTAPSSVADPPDQLALRLVEGARRQIGLTTVYDGSYRRLAYPGGDVPAERGVCTDIVVRAYRTLGIDLQELVHEDMRGAWEAYPHLWGLSRPDPNIDHRRVPNLSVFFRRAGAALPVQLDAAAFQPGDLVTWRLSSGLPHIGIVSDHRRDGRPLVIHNIGAGAEERDVLFRYEITGHFRYLPDGPPEGGAVAPGGTR